MPGETNDVIGTVQPDEAVTPEAQEASEAQERASPNDATPATLAMLEAIRSGSTDPQKLLMSMLGTQAADQPEIGMLFKLLAEENEDSEDAIREQLREELREEHAEAFSELGMVAEKLLAENENARERLDSLAAAIGACPICFGENLLCDTCHGAGEPGSRAPQPEEFQRYVRPAVERVRAALRRQPVRRPWPRKPPSNLAATETPERAGAGVRP